MCVYIVSTQYQIASSTSVVGFDPPIEALTMHIQNIVIEYDQEISQSQTADNPVASRGRAAQPSRDTRKTN